MAIPLTSDSAPAHAAPIDGDQTLIVELREGDPEPVDWVHEPDDSEVERGTVSAGGGRKGKRAEYRCAACSYGIVVYEQPPSCPMCGEVRWEHVEWRPFSRLLDDPFPFAPKASDVASTRTPRQRRASRSATFARVKPEHHPEK